MLLAAQVLIYLDVIVALRGIFFVCRDNFGGLRNDGLQCSCRRSPRAHLQGDVVPHGAAGRSTGSVGGAERGGGGCVGGGGSGRVKEEMPGGWIIVKFIVSALTLYDCEMPKLDHGTTTCYRPAMRLANIPRQTMLDTVTPCRTDIRFSEIMSHCLAPCCVICHIRQETMPEIEVTVTPCLLSIAR